ncbi:MAG: HEAT repeat domain-containing protein [Ferruginibacter sp.]
MGFYDLEKEKRKEVVALVSAAIRSGIENKKSNAFIKYFSDEDTYIRKAAYLATGKIFNEQKKLQAEILDQLKQLSVHENERIRQTVINAAGEIGKFDFGAVALFMEKGLFDEHHSVRNAVIGSIKKMGEKNPKPVLEFAARYLDHPDKEIRREICHGIELRGRIHPQDILPLLKQLEFDTTARVKNTLIHVIGQISYKKGCLETVISHLKNWKNKDLVVKAFEEIIDVHDRYKDFAELTTDQATKYIEEHFK